MFERFTAEVAKVIFLARAEAYYYGGTCVETEHLLLGLFKGNKPLFGRLLFNVPKDSVAKYLASSIPRHERTVKMEDLDMSEGCKRILGYAAKEAEGNPNRDITTEHLLVGILEEQEGLAAQILSGLGLQLDAVRKKLEAEYPPIDRRFL